MLTLNQLLPAPVRDIDAVAAYAHPAPASGHLRAKMVTSVDGAAALDGRVGALTGPADQELLVLLRSLCDVLLVGAGTVRAEGYGPVRARRELADVRRGLGEAAAAPRLAVLTRDIGLDLGSAAFVEATERPIVVTTDSADPARVREAEKVADVVVAGERLVDLRVARELLVAQGLPRILSEGPARPGRAVCPGPHRRAVPGVVADGHLWRGAADDGRCGASGAPAAGVGRRL